MSSLNKVELIGNLGNNPEIKTMNNGSKVANLSIATSESWKDKNSGEKKTKTEWHRVVIFGDGLVNVCESYLKKGSKVFLQGSLQTRKWQDTESGQDRYTTEIVMNGFGSKLIMLGGNSEGEQTPQQAPQQTPTSVEDDDIPF